ncbi:DUF1883 domain-containing protein [Tumebacillus flagellatus]|uniref:DUF1883 domain-containing protein n=1 Tax=Tumebacillus flagellatus TaxID=1157490 RepID=UPI0009DCB3F7
MFEHLRSREYLEQGAMIRVWLEDACWVRVMDDLNYNNFRNGRDYRGNVTVVTVSPHEIVVPYSGFWNVVLDLNGSAGSIRHSIEYIR